MTRWQADAEYAQLMREHDARLLRLAVLLTGSSADAEDALQETFIAVANAWPRVRRDTALAYVHTTLARKAIDLKRRTRERPASQTPDSAGEDDSLLRYEQDRQFLAMLSDVPAGQRAVLVLRYYCDLTDRQIGEQLGCSAENVRSQAHRGLTKLRTRLMYQHDKDGG